MSHPTIAARADELYREQTTKRHVMVSRMFAVLLVVQYVACIAAAFAVSPYAWAGKDRVLHMHVWWPSSAARGSRCCPSCWRSSVPPLR